MLNTLTTLENKDIALLLELAQAFKMAVESPHTEGEIKDDLIENARQEFSRILRTLSPRRDNEISDETLLNFLVAENNVNDTFNQYVSHDDSKRTFDQRRLCFRLSKASGIPTAEGTIGYRYTEHPKQGSWLFITHNGNFISMNWEKDGTIWYTINEQIDDCYEVMLNRKDGMIGQVIKGHAKKGIRPGLGKLNATERDICDINDDLEKEKIFRELTRTLEFVQKTLQKIGLESKFSGFDLSMD